MEVPVCVRVCVCAYVCVCVCMCVSVSSSGTYMYLENVTVLGEQTRVLHRRFYITGVLCVLTEPEGHLVSYSILCPLWPGALSGSKKLKRRTVVIHKELVSWSFVRPN